MMFWLMYSCIGLSLKIRKLLIEHFKMYSDDMFFSICKVTEIKFIQTCHSVTIECNATIQSAPNVK